MTDPQVTLLWTHNSQGATKPHRHKEPPSYKDLLWHTVLPRHTQQHSGVSKSWTHAHTQPLARHSVTTSQGPSHSSGTHTHHSVTAYSHTPTPPPKVCSHSSHTMVTHTHIYPKTARLYSPRSHWPPCRPCEVSTFPSGQSHSVSPSRHRRTQNSGSASWFLTPGSGGGIFSYN